MDETTTLLSLEFEEMRAARPDADPWLVLEGDWGGQIYLTVPWKLVKHDADIDGLLREMDRVAWSCNEGDGAGAYLYDPSEHGLAAQDGVSGGMGGGELADGLWLHEEFRGSRNLLGMRFDDRALDILASDADDERDPREDDVPFRISDEI